jgi:type III pantothenate kinase
VIASQETLIAVDVGNSRAKWGLFFAGKLTDTASLPLDDPAAYDQQWRAWMATSSSRLAPHASPLTWSIASVNPDGTRPLIDWLRDGGFEPLDLDDPARLPLRVELDRPEAVGIDRLLDAVAVNARRQPGRPAIIVDAGSAITVDAVSADGAFLGGAIAVGLGLAARALHECTYWLPLVNVTAPAAPLGRSTPDAMHSGLFWGAVGAVRELVRQLASSLGGSPELFLTGGDAVLIAPHVDPAAHLAPDLTLHGIYLATQHVRSTH